MTDTVQMQMIRRYARMLREQQAQMRAGRVGARVRRFSRPPVPSVRDAIEPAARAALDTTRPTATN